MSMRFRTEHTRRLPHFHRIGATFFITTHLYGSIPTHILQKLQLRRDSLIEQIKQEKQEDREKKIYMVRRAYFQEYDAYLDICQNGPRHLEIPAVAAIVEREIRRYDQQYYNLITFTLMPNHIHLVLDFSIQLRQITPFDLDLYTNVSEVMRKIKGSSGFHVNKVISNTGSPFWGVSYYDRYIRNYHHFLGAVNYTLNNVVKAKIVTHWIKHRHTWLNPDYRKLELLFPKRPKGL